MTDPITLTMPRRGWAALLDAIDEAADAGNVDCTDARLNVPYNLVWDAVHPEPVTVRVDPSAARRLADIPSFAGDMADVMNEVAEACRKALGR